MARCSSLTKRGTRCTKHCKPGQKTCPTHAPTGNEQPGGSQPLKINAKRIEAMVLGYLQTGTDAGAARAAGINRSTLRRWKAKAREDMAAGLETDLTRMLDALEDAEDDLLAELGAQVQAHAIAKGDIPAMFRLMAAIDPDKYSQTKNVRHGGDPNSPPIGVTGPPTTQVLHITLGAELDDQAAAILADEV